MDTCDGVVGGATCGARVCKCLNCGEQGCGRDHCTKQNWRDGHCEECRQPGDCPTTAASVAIAEAGKRKD